jgi:hypothetical protein
MNHTINFSQAFYEHFHIFLKQSRISDESLSVFIKLSASSVAGRGLYIYIYFFFFGTVFCSVMEASFYLCRSDINASVFLQL